MEELLKAFPALSDDERLYREYYEDTGLGNPRLPGDFSQKSELLQKVRFRSSLFQIMKNPSRIALAKLPCFIPPYIRSSSQLLTAICLLRGRMLFHACGKSEELQDEALLLIAPGVYHAEGIFDEDTIALEISVPAGTMQGIPGIIPRLMMEKAYAIMEDPDHALPMLIARIHRELSFEEPAMEMLALLISELSIEAGRLPQRLYRHQDDEASGYLSLIDSNFSSITLPAFAGHYGITEQYASSQIKTKLGDTFMNILKAKRMEEALHRLLTSYRTCKDIAEEVGYSSQAHLSRAFSDYYGLTPMKLRDMQRLHML